MKRNLMSTLVLAMLLSATLLAGCGQAVTEPQEPTLRTAGLEGGDGDKFAPSGLEGGDGDKITP